VQDPGVAVEVVVDLFARIPRMKRRF